MAWNDLTERQKSLDRAIGKSGVKIENTRRCVNEVMQKIGANANEESFVISRIQLRINAQTVLDDTDLLMNRTEAMLKDFEEDDKEWERKGKSLGFNFWDRKEKP